MTARLRLPRRRLFAAICGASLGVAALVGARSAPAFAQSPPVMQKPAVTKAADVHFPEGADRSEKQVRLNLTIDATGRVIAVEIVESAGDAFDQEADRVARATEFSPATRDGVPIAAKIPFVVTFTPPAETLPVATPAPRTEPPAPAKTGSLSGDLRTQAGQGVAGVKVTIAIGEFTVTVTTNAQGHYEAAPLPLGHAHLKLESPGFQTLVVDATIVEGSARADATLIAEHTDRTISIAVVGEKPTREATKVTLTADEISHIPGTNGDALASLTNLPGVARPPLLSGLLIVRGSAPTDTSIFVDGTNVPIVYHLGGLSSVIPSEMLERIDFYPGNFGPEYGRAIGGIVDVGVRSPKKNWSAMVETSALEGRAIVEGPITSDTRFAVAARRSWIDVWLSLLEGSGGGFSIAPVYYDYQAEIEHDFSSTTKGRLLLFGSDDRFKVIVTDPSAADPSAGGALSSATTFWRLQARLDTRVSDNVQWTNTAAVGGDTIAMNEGSWQLQEHTYPITFRSDLRAKISRECALVGGIDMGFVPFDVDARIPTQQPPGQAQGPYLGRP